MRFAAAITLTLAFALGSSGCGERTETIPERPTGAFAAALATVSGSPANTGIGVGWLDQAALRDLGGEQGAISEALAPNASAVYAASPALARRFGFDPRRAERLLSVGGSYAFGLRMDGVAAPRLERILIRDGAKHRLEGSATLVDAAPYASVPQPLLDAGVRGLGARDAFTADATVLAISDTARATLAGGGQRLVDNPTYAAAADCLGDVVAARVIPAKLVRSAELGVDLIALGIERPPPGGSFGHEVICTVGSSAEVADRSAEALRSALAPGAADPITDDAISGAVASADVQRLQARGLELVRGRIDLAAGQAARLRVRGIRARQRRRVPRLRHAGRKPERLARSCTVYPDGVYADNHHNARRGGVRRGCARSPRPRHPGVGSRADLGRRQRDASLPYGLCDRRDRGDGVSQRRSLSVTVPASHSRLRSPSSSATGLRVCRCCAAGLPPRRVASVAFASDTLSITTMEIVDNAVVLAIPGAIAAGLDTLLFWGSLAFALPIAGMFAVPVNRWLLARGKGHAAVHETGIHGGPPIRLVAIAAAISFAFGAAVLIAEAIS